MQLAGLPVDVETMLLAMIADATRALAWLNTKDAAEGKNQPRSIAAMLAGKGEQQGVGFEDAAAFEAWRASMIGGEKHA